jgi:hypothetical protein
MLLNTSFNRAGEPLVETPADAGRCVVASTADYLVVDQIPYRNVATGGLWHSSAYAGEATSRTIRPAGLPIGDRVLCPARTP